MLSHGYIFGLGFVYIQLYVAEMCIIFMDITLPVYQMWFNFRIPVMCVIKLFSEIQESSA